MAFAGKAGGEIMIGLRWKLLLVTVPLLTFSNSS